MRRGLLSVLGWLCFLLLAAGAQAQYQRPTPNNGDPPTDVDLETYDGASKSLTVELLNLTPYDITFDGIPGVSWSITSANEAAMQNRNRFDEKSFMFVPVGVPSLIPRAPAQDFVSPYLEDGVTPNPDYDPDYVDTTTHPYSMVFSWDDRGGFVVDNWVKWTVKGVEFPTGSGYASQDVGLGLWMYRNKPTFKLTSSYLPTLIKDSLSVTFKLLSLPVKAESPKAWANAFLGLAKLAKAGTDFAKENTQENDGNKMWVASYVIPNPTSLCVESGMDCTPSLMKPADTGDAVYTEWAPGFAGPSHNGTGPESAAEAELVVSLHVFRGQKAKQCDPAYYPNKCPLGSESVVMITVTRVTDFAVATLCGAAPDQSSGHITPGKSPIDPHSKIRLFLLQAGAGRIRQLLAKQGRPGLLTLRSIVSGLPLAQKQVVVQMIRDMASGRRPTQQERLLMHLIANELQARLKLGKEK